MSTPLLPPPVHKCVCVCVCVCACEKLWVPTLCGRWMSNKSPLLLLHCLSPFPLERVFVVGAGHRWHLISVGIIPCMLQPPWNRLLTPGVFKLSCSTPFTPFLHLVSVYRLFHLYFIPKTLHNTSVFSCLLAADFCLTSHSPVFVSITTLLYVVPLALCGHLQTQHVCCALHPMSGEDGILVAEDPCGVQHASSAQIFS